MLRVLVLSFVIVGGTVTQAVEAGPLTIAAASSARAPARATVPSFLCGPAINALGMNFDDDLMRVTNLVFRTAYHAVSGAPTLFFEASAANKTYDRIAISVEAIGWLDGAALFAVSATGGDYLGSLPPRSSAILTGSILTPETGGGQADEICVRVRRWPASGDAGITAQDAAQ